MSEQRVKGGRPRKHSPDAKRPTMAFRMGSQLHERLIASAAANERSLSEEIERILEAHFTAADQRTLIREEVRAAMDEHEANLAVARVRRSAALEELARAEAAAKRALNENAMKAIANLGRNRTRNGGWVV